MEARRVDVIVLYKVDRLTRSLTDFAKLAERFEAKQVAFVSVTQQLNTATSTGRLMLNMLLSFAQLEHELTGERIRDKIRASKAKGLWMGGFVPLGYDAQGRTLVINDAEAPVVRRLFQLYLETGCVRKLQLQAAAEGLRSKVRSDRNGKQHGGNILGRGHLYRLLQNPLYRGQIRHRELLHAGQHPALIDEQTWTAVQAQLARNRQGHRRREGARERSLLAGLLVDPSGRPFVSSHANKQGRRYRYYVQALAPVNGSTTQKALRLPAAEIEAAVRNSVVAALDTPRELRRWLGLGHRSTSLARLVPVATALAQTLRGAEPLAATESFRRLLSAVTFDRTELRLRLSRVGLRQQLDLPAGDADDRDEGPVVAVPIRLAHRGEQLKVIGEAPLAAGAAVVDPTLVKTLARAHAWYQRLKATDAPPLRAIARENNVTPTYVTRVLRLAFLAPSLVDTIVAGRQRRTLTADELMLRTELPLAWPDQAEVLGAARPKRR